MSDATFEDGADRPVSVGAEDADDLRVISAMAQDAVFPITEMTWERGRRRFAVLLNRFRWEDRADAEARNRPYERVRSLLVVEDVLKVASQGIDRSETETILSVLSIDFEPGDDAGGRVVMTLAGDGAIALDVECINLRLRDVTRPYAAPSRQMPEHGD